MITDISPEYGDAESPPDVVLTGSNFGTTKADLTIVLSGYVVPEAKITSISDTSITISGMKKKSELITDGVYTHGTLSF
ncbi:MAG: IPT/TIG domain-containing protein, partial [Kangiellaceae bacterium]|nr:IPT/TIG domain-containing protein [Kangiellaceae bacterium]